MVQLNLTLGFTASMGKVSALTGAFMVACEIPCPDLRSCGTETVSMHQTSFGLA